MYMYYSHKVETFKKMGVQVYYNISAVKNHVKLN